MNKKRYSLGITHPQILRGGSEAATLWAIEALKKDYDVSLITTNEIDLNALNAFYGTQIQLNEIHLRKANVPFFIQRFAGGDALRGAYFQRYCKKIASEFDIAINGYNFCDLGIPSIHCIADFSWDEEIRRRYDPLPQGIRGIFHEHNIFQKTYRLFVKKVSNNSGRNLFADRNLILANSKWTSEIIRQKYGASVDVLYPPVAAEFPKIEYKDKEFGFVCIGRISPEKRIEQMIEILKAVRKRGHDIHFHIIGGMDRTHYGRKIEELYRAERGWVVIEGSQWGKAKEKLLAEHRFGIHGRLSEPFGISVAEMIKAGCITFAPNDGGQIEIINNPLLLYKDIQIAVEKIDRVLRNDALQNSLRIHLEKQGKKFTTREFVRGIRNAVKNIKYEIEHSNGF